MSERLSATLVKSLPGCVQCPRYDAEQHGAGIIHIGIGAFHRGHQAVFTDDALAQSGGDWRIIGVSLRSQTVKEQLNPQDGFFTLIEKSTGKSTARVIGSIKEVIAAREEPQKLSEALADPSIKIVTMTVTEKGYHYDQSSQSIDWESADIQHDLVFPNEPKSMPGLLVKACLKRMKSEYSHSSKLSIISCDNLPENGAIVKSVVLGLASRVDKKLVTWIQNNVSFCSSMVDRIVPKVTVADGQALTQQYGYEDQGLIVTEPFKQWVIEDNFCTERPDWESAGVLFVKQVSDYEKLKLRTLNGSHSALAYMGVLLGHKWIHQAVIDPLLVTVIQRLMQKETGPTIPTFPNVDLAEYQQQIIQRFENSDIAYATQQVASDGSQKLQQRILQAMEELYRENKEQHTACLMATLVCWLRYLKGSDEKGVTYIINDPIADLLHALVNEHWEQPIDLVDALFKQTSIFPTSLKTTPNFTKRLIDGIHKITELGTHAYLSQILQDAE
ncbi:mannitol dehydrogenase family protein [Brumicola blandensis]|jgi:fructuronate reductase|uniref:Mannitol dehydrogenase family protein n=1 Tax=Brumicola blandensis TaxID=3075611 RepID=A0AAW8R271_9ALTE|nr:mannitol dehydrogenase family protein [Alteromonas sp. W409]MDT0582218.1 mannitol dehydrogenase family protein [Alteromonas sp. W409]